MLWVLLACLVWLVAGAMLLTRKTRPVAWPLTLAMAATFPGVFLFQIVVAPVVAGIVLSVVAIGWVLEPGKSTTTNPYVIAVGLFAILGALLVTLVMSMAGFYEGWRAGWSC